MKSLLLALVILFTVGCGEESTTSRSYKWIVNVKGRVPDQVQADLNTFAVRGWYPTYDDDLEASGHYIYMTKYMSSAEAEMALPELLKALKANGR